MIIIGLGNPGEEYSETRHNAGRMAVCAFAKKHIEGDFEYNKKVNAQVLEGKLAKEKVILVLPDTFMNKSGESVKGFVKFPKQAKKMIVVHDDLDIPLGKFKVSFNKSSGGHKGVESVIKAVKTQEFYRIRIGVSPQTPSGKIKKPSGEDLVNNFIVAPFKPKETDELKAVVKHIVGCLEMALTDSVDRAMSEYNALANK
jgi:PTH1 family peptidyl-tRNA hydrolase